MRRFLATIVLFLLSFQLMGNDGIPNPRLFRKGVYFPVVETPAVFTSTVDDKDFLVFIEYSDSLKMKGHYMAWEETMTDTLPFRLEAKGRNAILYYEDQKETFRPRIKSMDTQHAIGYARLSLFGTAHFQFNILEEPLFHDFEIDRYQDSVFSVEEVDNICYARVPSFMTLKTIVIKIPCSRWRRSTISVMPMFQAFGRNWVTKPMSLTRSFEWLMP